MKKLAVLAVAAALTLYQHAYSQTPGATAASASESIAPSTATIAGREQAFRKMLEGQKQMWKSQRVQSQTGKTNALRLAKAAFQQAIDLDPTLAEAYTALAELAITLPPGDLAEGIRLGAAATTIDRDNFGGHRILARLHTIKSRINNGQLDTDAAALAVKEWREVARLDGRNAEAWAFISEFAVTLRKPEEQIEALRKWISSAPPLDVQFYGRVMGGAPLTPETATIKLAAALAEAGKRDEAATLLSTLIADDADNSDAIAMLGEMVDATEGAAADATVRALQQAVYANPSNVSLIEMLARLQARTGQAGQAAELLKAKSAALAKTDKEAASSLLASLGDRYAENDRFDDAVSAYEQALTLRGAGAADANGNREFTQYAIEKLIHLSKLANRPALAKSYIERAKTIFGSDDLFANKQHIMLLQAQSNHKEALAVLRVMRAKRPSDISLLRMEATILADLGQVEAAVDLIRKKSGARVAQTTVGESTENGTVTIPVPPTDEFSDLLFISNLYARAGKGVDAVSAANQALSAAAGTDRKQIARVTLATGQQLNGDFQGAEATLREVLKESPGNPMALNNLGYFLVERGDKLQEAVDMISQAVKIDPRNPSYLDSLGWGYFKLGKLSEAERYLKDAARNDTDSATIMEHLGDLYRQKNELDKARSSWQRALRLATETAAIERLKRKIAG